LTHKTWAPVTPLRRYLKLLTKESYTSSVYLVRMFPKEWWSGAELLYFAQNSFDVVEGVYTIIK